MPLRLRGGLRNTVPRILVQPSCSALISAFALRTLTSNKHIPLISTPPNKFSFRAQLKNYVIASMQSGATCLQGLRSACIHVATPLKKAKPQVLCVSIAVASSASVAISWKRNAKLFLRPCHNYSLLIINCSLSLPFAVCCAKI